MLCPSAGKRARFTSSCPAGLCEFSDLLIYDKLEKTGGKEDGRESRGTAAKASPNAE